MVAGDPPEADGQTAATERAMGNNSDLSFMVHRGFIFEGVEGSILKSLIGMTPKRAKARELGIRNGELNRDSEMLRFRGTEREKELTTEDPETQRRGGAPSGASPSLFALLSALCESQFLDAGCWDSGHERVTRKKKCSRPGEANF